MRANKFKIVKSKNPLELLFTIETESGEEVARIYGDKRAIETHLLRAKLFKLSPQLLAFVEGMSKDLQIPEYRRRQAAKLLSKI